MKDTLADEAPASATSARHEPKNINGTNTTKPLLLVQRPPKRNSNSTDGARPEHHWENAPSPRVTCVALAAVTCGHHVRESDNCGWRQKECPQGWTRVIHRSGTGCEKKQRIPDRNVCANGTGLTSATSQRVTSFRVRRSIRRQPSSARKWSKHEGEKATDAGARPPQWQDTRANEFRHA